MFQSYFQHGGLLSQLLDHKGAQGAHRNQQDPAIRRIQQVHPGQGFRGNPGRLEAMHFQETPPT